MSNRLKDVVVCLEQRILSFGSRGSELGGRRALEQAEHTHPAGRRTAWPPSPGSGTARSASNRDSHGRESATPKFQERGPCIRERAPALQQIAAEVGAFDTGDSVRQCPHGSGEACYRRCRPAFDRRQEVGDAEARGRFAAHTAKTSSSLTREPPTRLWRRLDRSAERSRWLAGQARAPNVATATTRKTHGGT